MCEALNIENHGISMEIMKIETRLESTPTQNIINPDELREDMQKYSEGIDACASVNLSLEDSIRNADMVVKKIDDFLKRFDYPSWKQKKQEVVDLQAEIKDVSARLSITQKDRHSLYEKRTLLEQVPCGQEYSHCRFIRSAYEKISKEDDIEGEFHNLTNF